MVVPGSAQKIVEDQEHALYTVTLFKVFFKLFFKPFNLQKVIDEYRANCREQK